MTSKESIDCNQFKVDLVQLIKISKRIFNIYFSTPINNSYFDKQLIN